MKNLVILFSNFIVSVGIIAVFWLLKTNNKIDLFFFFSNDKTHSALNSFSILPTVSLFIPYRFAIFGHPLRPH